MTAIDVALAAGADGVHLGQDDGNVIAARERLGPGPFIGLTVQTVEHARAAPLAVIDYVGIGGVFATSSKNNPRPPIGIAGLREIVEVFRYRIGNFPMCAIAGITKENAGEVIAAGVDGVSVISALSLARDPTAAARELRDVVDAALARARANRAGHARARRSAGAPRHDGHRGHHCRFGFRRRRRHSGRPQDVLGARRLWRVGDRGADGAEYAAAFPRIHDVPAEFVTAQIDAVFSDFDVAAVKIGMLSNAAVIAAVADGLAKYNARNIVLDPVMVATSGDRLLDPRRDRRAASASCFRCASVITPNLPEAAALLDAPIATR